MLILPVLCNPALLHLQPGPASTLCREDRVLLSCSSVPLYPHQPSRCWASLPTGTGTGGFSWVQLSKSLSLASDTPSSSAVPEGAMSHHNEACKVLPVGAVHCPPAAPPAPQLVLPVSWQVCSSHKQKSTSTKSLLSVTASSGAETLDQVLQGEFLFLCKSWPDKNITAMS